MDVKLDWYSYFMEFQRIHGGNPVEYKGWLLYQDGYRYSPNNYAGPEVEPEPHETLHFMREYWRIRREVVAAKAREMERTLLYLEQERSVRSAPLQQRTVTELEDGTMKYETAELDIESLQVRLKWLQDDEADCTQRLEALWPTTVMA